MRARSFAQHILRHLRSAAERTLATEDVAFERGWLQSLDARAKLVGLLAILLAGVWSRSVPGLLFLLGLVAVLAWLSRLPLRLFVAVGATLVLTSFIALPSMFMIPGPPAFRIPLLGVATVPGIRTFFFLLLRVGLASSVSSLLILTTPWPYVLKSLRVFQVPVIAIVILSMTYRYILVLLRQAEDLFEARESRRVGKLTRSEERQMIASGVGVLLSRALATSENVYLAMRSRGYSGEVYLLTEFRMNPKDWMFAAVSIAVALLLADIG